MADSLLASALITEAAHLGVKSVPALALDGQVVHIKLGANLHALT